jgi:translation initiation factor 2 beta subunit (eIF-2beta)/eIF-5
MKNVIKVNIPSTVQDSNYRYWAPKMDIVTQGSGNGIKTNIKNLTDIAERMLVPPEYILTYFKSELNTNSEIKNNTYLINGSHTYEKLQKVLDQFSHTFLLCQKCKLQEVRMHVSSDKSKIKTKCSSCGHLAKISDSEKLCSLIKRNPPKYPKEEVVKQAKTNGEEEGPKTDDIKSLVREYMSFFSKEFDGKDNDEILKIIESKFQGVNLGVDFKFLTVVWSLFDSNIYSQMKTKGKIIKTV